MVLHAELLDELGIQAIPHSSLKLASLLEVVCWLTGVFGTITSLVFEFLRLFIFIL